MDQAVADSSTFIKRMKNKDPQQIALEKAISDFWDTLDVPQEPSPVKIASYPSIESLNEEPKEELTEAEHEYYNRKRLTGMKCGEGVRPKDSSNRVSAFQDYTSAMMSALNNPWKP